MSIVTKTGDAGTTGLFGGKRIPKSSPRLHAYGTVDELNAALGVTLSLGQLSNELSRQLVEVQHLLFRVGGDLATPIGTKEKEQRIGLQHIGIVEQWIIALEKSLPPQTHFLLPGGSPGASAFHLARTICRRAEREIVLLEETEEINTNVRIFLNRLSDYLFLAARRANIDAGTMETKVEY